MKEIISQLGLEKYSISSKQDPNTSFSLKVNKKGNNVEITYHLKHHFLKALALLKTFEDEEEFVKEEKSKFEHLGYLIDVARDAVPQIKTLKEQALNLALNGFDQMYLYLEDLFEVKNEPFYGHLRGRYCKEEIKELDDYCCSLGIELIPAIQTLAHLNGIFKWPEYFSINDINDILLVDSDKTYKLIENLFETVSEYFSSKTLHIGMDEAHNLGRGKYLNEFGYKKASEIMLEHLNKVSEMSKKYGFKLEMWSDMFFRSAFGSYNAQGKKLPEEIVNLVPSNVDQVYWDYVNDDKKILQNMFENHALFKGKTIFASGAWKWNGWNPQNNFAIYLANIQLKICEKQHIDKVILTGWSDDGGEASLFSTLPSIVYYGAYCYGHNTKQNYLNKLSQKVFGFNFKDYLASDLLLVKKEEEICGYNYLNYGNIAKIIMYTDPFSSIYGSILNRFSLDNIPKLRKQMRRAKKRNLKFELYFRNLENLCSCLENKVYILKNLKSAYLQKNKGILEEIANIRIPKLIKSIDVFISSFKEQWLKENKTNGFEIHTNRLGGEKERMFFIKDIINKFLSGDIEKITELEQKNLLLKDEDALVLVLYTNWGRMWTLNVT